MSVSVTGFQKQLSTGKIYREQKKDGQQKVTAVIITYNEELNIRRTLSRLAWCDEIVILDSYSTDNTINICKEFDCKVFYRSFDGYGTQKQAAVAEASHDWVLVIDADEVLSEELVHEMQQALSGNTDQAAFSIPMNLVFLNKEFKVGREANRFYIRLFNRRKGGFTADTVHESILVNGTVQKLSSTIKHYSYTSLHQCIEKCNKYSTLSSEMAFRKGKNKSVPLLLMALPFNFFKYYLLDLNFANGLKGFYWSVFSTYYHFAKYVKLNELNAAQQNKSSRYCGENNAGY